MDARLKPAPDTDPGAGHDEGDCAVELEPLKKDLRETPMAEFVLAIDQGTTSTRAIAFDGDYTPVAMAREEFPQHYPASGWVEHDPEDLWQTTLNTARTVIASVGGPEAITAI